MSRVLCERILRIYRDAKYGRLLTGWDLENLKAARREAVLELRKMRRAG